MSATVTGTVARSATKRKADTNTLARKFGHVNALSFQKVLKHVCCDSCLAVRRCGTVRDRTAAVNHAHVQGACWLRITWIAHGIPTHPASAAAILIKVSVVVLVKESVLQATFALNARRVDGFTVCRASGCYAYVTKSPLCVFFFEKKKGIRSVCCALSRVVRGLYVSGVE